MFVYRFSSTEKLIKFFLLQMNEVLDHIKFDHGYTSSSPPVQNVGGSNSNQLLFFLLVFDFVYLTKWFKCFFCILVVGDSA